jgi:hypothetical protein
MIAEVLLDAVHHRTLVLAGLAAVDCVTLCPPFLRLIVLPYPEGEGPGVRANPLLSNFFPSREENKYR